MVGNNVRLEKLETVSDCKLTFSGPKSLALGIAYN